VSVSLSYYVQAHALITVRMSNGQIWTRTFKQDDPIFLDDPANQAWTSWTYFGTPGI